VIFLDAIDKQLWIELSKNCRHSYQYLADRIGISANAVRHRVEKLLETGFIKDWYVGFQPAMIDAQFAFIEVQSDGSRDEEWMIETLGSNPMIFVVLPLTTGDFALHAYYVGAAGLLELGSFIRSVESVTNVKVHPTISNEGKKLELKPLHLRVLRWLVEDPRLSISELARHTKLTARRVRKIVNEFINSNAFDFSFIWNPNAGDSLAFISKIRYDSKETQPEGVNQSIQELYPLEYFYSHISSIEPVMFSVFMVDHLFDVQKISRQLRKLNGVRALSTMIYYSATVIDPLTRIKMMELLSESQL
jgi:DNA-binding Lrp family transcriptional regulator